MLVATNTEIDPKDTPSNQTRDDKICDIQGERLPAQLLANSTTRESTDVLNGLFLSSAAQTSFKEVQKTNKSIILVNSELIVCFCPVFRSVNRKARKHKNIPGPDRWLVDTIFTILTSRDLKSATLAFVPTSVTRDCFSRLLDGKITKTAHKKESKFQTSETMDLESALFPYFDGLHENYANFGMGACLHFGSNFQYLLPDVIPRSTIIPPLAKLREVLQSFQVSPPGNVAVKSGQSHITVHELYSHVLNTIINTKPTNLEVGGAKRTPKKTYQRKVCILDASTQSHHSIGVSHGQQPSIPSVPISHHFLLAVPAQPPPPLYQPGYPPLGLTQAGFLLILCPTSTELCLLVGMTTCRETRPTTKIILPFVIKSVTWNLL